MSAQAVQARRNATTSRPRRAPGPALPALEALDQTHRQVVAHLGALDALVHRLQQHGPDSAARASAAEICGFFGTVARQHHADEERSVFPALLRSGEAELTQHVLRLQQDHGWIEEDWLELELQLQAVAGGYSWYELETLRQQVAVFVALYQEHIALEESLIYPRARQLHAAEQAGIAARSAGA